MLTFAPPSLAPSTAGWLGALAAFFSTTPEPPAPQQATASAGAADAPLAPREPLAAAPTDESGNPCAQPGEATYWPCDRLNAFILQMAAHGHCVSAAMMLGHRPYAVQRLAAAQQVPDDALRNLAAELQAYFDAPPDSAAQQLAVH